MAAAFGTTVVVLVVGGVLIAVLGAQQGAELDRRLATLSRILTPVLIRTAGASGGDLPRPLDGRVADAVGSAYVAEVVRDGDVVGSFAAGGASAPALPILAPGLADVDTVSGPYRILTASPSPGLTVSVGLPQADTDRRITAIRRTGLLVGLVAVVAAAGLGWLLAGPAVRPLRVLRDRAATADTGLRPGDLAQVRGAREAEELGAALAGMLSRVQAARRETEQALAAARSFAANAGHELRTPLASMRTDLDVLRAHPDLPPAERGAIVAGVAQAQRRLEATLAALSQLAHGELADRASFGPVDVTDLVARAVDDARRAAPAVRFEGCMPEADILAWGWAEGVRLAVDNLLSNAVHRGQARQVIATVAQTGGVVSIVVDDDGCGVPEAERAAVFDRFVRGAGSAPGGSGLGLALVAQQARLHGGRAWLSVSPSGGTRATVELGPPA